MNGPEHYTRAEQLLREVRDGHQEGTDVAAILAAAQVHATLALAAATALNDNAADSGGMPLEDFDAWVQAAAVRKPKRKGGEAR
ncbi:hypothetical protein [Streptomyces sp. G1]|uniref:hypothetical protein n=1 Tax=Streptomyces sp. G1 TaxID=361572 RepID=UPI002030E3AB|nr:hypothetical protein [Streptomyces sp. G1]MCM1974596.1 hypothetical protein [Streptomyces sp. G1]